MIQEKTKRDVLNELSRTLKPKIKDGTFKTLNEALVNYYAEQGHTNLKTFNAWLKEGYIVKKGEKALLLWGSPSKYSKPDRDKESNFFPMAFMFSEKQVEPRETKEHRR